MRGKLSDINNSTTISFDFELSETPKAMILKLIESQSKEAMIGVFGGEDGYNETKTQGDFDTQNSSIGLTAGGEVITLAWDQPLQAQVGEQVKTLQASGKEVPFVANISKVVG
ncbi:MAG: hypothetical protein FWH03_00715 [Firmicutes bacterium]|nr:hypothetical protein [Bacillota bacterium]